MTNEKRSKWSTRFLKRYVVSSDAHEFVGRIFDLSIVALNFEAYEDLAKYPDCKYVYHTNLWLSSMVGRIESLNMVGDILWPEPDSISRNTLPVSRYEWLRIAGDVFLMRFVSVIDCALLLTNEVFEAALEPRRCLISNIEKAGVSQNVIDVLKDMARDQRNLREERNRRFHHAQERELSSDDMAFRNVALFEHIGQGLRGVDLHGRRINIERYFKEGLVGLQRDFNSENRSLSKALDRLYDLLWEEFESRFSPRFNDPEHGFGVANRSK